MKRKLRSRAILKIGLGAIPAKWDNSCVGEGRELINGTTAGDGAWNNSCELGQLGMGNDSSEIGQQLGVRYEITAGMLDNSWDVAWNKETTASYEAGNNT
jgi:hypothetical protein